MRNIYDIIKEQKSLIDINMSSRDLNYVIETFSKNDFYIQEGMGESIKGLGKKIVEFIKKIIAKIKEMIRKVIDFFRGNKDEVVKMEEKIAKADAKAKEKKEEKKEEPKAEEKKEEPKAEEKKEEKKEEPKAEEKKTEFKERMKALNAPTVKPKAEEKKEEPKAEEKKEEKKAEPKVEEKKEEPKAEVKKEEKKAEPKIIGTKLGGGLTNALRFANIQFTAPNYPYMSEAMKNIEGLLFRCEDFFENKNILESDLDPAEFFKTGNGKRAFDRCVKDFNRGDETVRSSEIINKIVEYVTRGDDNIRYLQKLDRETEDEFNKIIRQTLNIEKNGDLDQKVANKVTRMATTVSNIVNRYIHTFANARARYLKVCWEATNKYCEAKNR